MLTMKDELLKDLTEEQIAKIKACKNNEEILKLAKQEGIELTDEQLEAISGGSCTNDYQCPNCGSRNIMGKDYLTSKGTGSYFLCRDCNHQWGHREH